MQKKTRESGGAKARKKTNEGGGESKPRHTEMVRTGAGAAFPRFASCAHVSSS
jgi:hypothetical protein